MKYLAILTLHFSLLTLHSSAAVPLRWTVETTRAQPATFESYQGETLAFEASLQSAGKPLELSGIAALYWQTNGMGSAYWETIAAVNSNRLSAVWTPEMDVGAKVYNCFIGVPGTIYHAAFQLRLRPSPGATPNTLPLPQPVIDFANVRVLNPPWGSGGGGCDTNAVDALANHAISTNAVTSNLTARLDAKLDDDFASLTKSAAFTNAVAHVSPPVEIPEKWALANVTNAAGGAVGAADVGAPTIEHMEEGWRVTEGNSIKRTQEAENRLRSEYNYNDNEIREIKRDKNDLMIYDGDKNNWQISCADDTIRGIVSNKISEINLTYNNDYSIWEITNPEILPEQVGELINIYDYSSTSPKDASVVEFPNLYFDWESSRGIKVNFIRKETDYIAKVSQLKTYVQRTFTINGTPLNGDGITIEGMTDNALVLTNGSVKTYGGYNVFASAIGAYTKDEIDKKVVTASNPTFSNAVSTVARTVTPPPSPTLRIFDDVRQCYWIGRMVNGVINWEVE